MPAAAAILGPLLIPIAKKLVKSGASKLAEKLLDSPAAGSIAGPIVDRVFEEFGLAADAPEPIDGAVDDLVARHGNRVGEIVEDVARDNNAQWVELWKTQVRDVNQTMRSEQHARSVLTRIWRPVFGLGFTAVYVLLGISLAVSILTSGDPLNGLVNVSGLIMAFVGSGAAVLGVQVWSRGEEKKAGAA